MAESLVIKTPRLRILPFCRDHLTARYIGWLNNRDLMRFSRQGQRIHTLESCRVYMESFDEKPNYFWAVEEVAQGLGHVGNMNAYVDLRHQVADVGILIGELGARGKGMGLEAWRGVCTWLLDLGGMRKISAGALSVNIPMLKIMESSGMVPDGVRRRHQLFEGKEVDIIHMALYSRSSE